MTLIFSDMFFGSNSSETMNNEVRVVSRQDIKHLEKVKASVRA